MTQEAPWAPFTEYVAQQNATGMSVIDVSSYLNNLDSVLSEAISTSFEGGRADEVGPDISHFARAIATRVKLESFLLVGPSDCDQALTTLKANLRMFLWVRGFLISKGLQAMFDFLTDPSKRRSDPLRFAKHTLMMTSDAAAAHELFRYIATMAGKHVHDEFGQVLWVTGDETAMSTRVRLLSDWVGSHLHRYDVRPRMRCTAADLEHNLSIFHISDSKDGIEDCTDLFVRAISIDPEINAARKTRVIFSDLSGWQFDELVRVKSLSENLSRRGVMTVIVDDDGALERSGVFSDTSYINKAVIDKSGKYSVEGASQGRLPHYRIPVQLLIPAHLLDEPSGDISRPAR